MSTTSDELHHCEICDIDCRDATIHSITKSHIKKCGIAERKAAKLVAAPAKVVEVAPEDAAETSADAKDKGARSRAWCFTLNNYTAADEELIQNHECEYVVYGHEHQDVGTPHLQGFIYFKSARTKSVLIRKFHPKAYYEISAGNADQNFAYCTKEDVAGYFEKGVRPAAGSRTDIQKMKASVNSGASMQELIESSTSYQSIKCAELLMKYQPTIPMRTNLKVHWIFGPTGTAKTFTAFQEASRLEGGIWVSGKNLQWWQGYSGQRNVIFDDFRGDFCEFHTLLRYLDVYPVCVEFKGGSSQLRASDIWITSAYPPDMIYRNRTNEDIAQLVRRITDVRQFITPFVKTIA